LLDGLVVTSMSQVMTVDGCGRHSAKMSSPTMPNAVCRNTKYQQPLNDIITQAERTQVQTVPSGFHVQTDSYLRVKYAKRGVRSAGGRIDLFSSGLKQFVTDIFSCGQNSCAPSCSYSFRLTRNSILILSRLASAVCFSHSWPQTSRLYNGRADYILAYFVFVGLVSLCITVQRSLGNSRGYACSELEKHI
jgi:hypothetical protein